MKPLVTITLLFAVSANSWAGPVSAPSGHDSHPGERNRRHADSAQSLQVYQEPHRFERDHRNDWSAVESVRTAKYRPRERAVALPRGTRAIRLQTTGRGVRVKHAWISYHDGAIQRVRALRGHLDRWDSATTKIRVNRDHGQPVLHLVLAPEAWGKRSRISIYSRGTTPRRFAHIRDIHNDYSTRVR